MCLLCCKLYLLVVVHASSSSGLCAITRHRPFFPFPVPLLCCSGSLRGAAKHAPVVVYISLSREQLELLRDVPGGDERRIGVLTGEMGVKVVGRPLDSDALKLLEAIVEHRGLQLAPAAEHAAVVGSLGDSESEEQD